jgi:hypothetical protein
MLMRAATRPRGYHVAVGNHVRRLGHRGIGKIQDDPASDTDYDHDHRLFVAAYCHAVSGPISTAVSA